ncbi:MAG TPA: nucleotide exchange factor GrpE [Patescibacteria group bacterium]|nr:nucleotide exchange factor GrpE [Patescibacteria group bacterium]
MNPQPPFDETPPTPQPVSAEETLQKERDTYLEGWKRALADYDNLKKDLGREKTATRQALAEAFFLAVLPVLDHFHQALRHRPKEGEASIDAWVTGVLRVREELSCALAGFGAVPFGVVGDLFDPRCHESVGARCEASFPDQGILEVLELGWRMGEKIVRPARVIINNLPPLSADAGGPPDG